MLQPCAALWDCANEKQVQRNENLRLFWHTNAVAPATHNTVGLYIEQNTVGSTLWGSTQSTILWGSTQSTIRWALHRAGDVVKTEKGYILTAGLAWWHKVIYFSYLKGFVNQIHNVILWIDWYALSLVLWPRESPEKCPVSSHWWAVHAGQ